MNTPSPNDPAAICASLRAIAEERATAARARHVEEHLQSKFESVQSVAAQVLAQWHWHDSLPALRSLLESHLGRPGPNHLCSVVAEAIGSVIKATDTPQIIRWYISLPDKQRRELLPAVAQTKWKRARPLFEQAWTSADRSLKRAIMVAANAMRASALFEPGLRDSAPDVREFAELLAGRRNV